MPVPNVVPSQGVVSRRARERIAGQSSCVLWFTGLSGSGKSTIAHVVEGALAERRKLAYVLDGDNLRHRLNSDLGFSATDRSENIRRAGEVAAILADAGLIVLSTFISPFRSDRARVRDAVGPERFLEIHVDAPLEVCERRDPKGFYRRARAGEIAEFTGISSPYEPPVAAALRLATAEMNVAEGAAAVVALLDRRGFLAPPSEGV